MSDVEYKKYINKERVISLLSNLVRIHSPYFHEEEIMEYVYNWFKERNLPAEYHEFHEDKITDFKGKNVIGKISGVDEGPTVLLNGHLDTVNICEGWTRDPLGAEIEDGKMYGVGTLDMKSGDVAIMLAVEAFINNFAEFNGEILYTFVCDEEGPYGLGTDALLLDGITDNADVAIVPEPSGGFNNIDFPCLCLGARGGWKYTVKFTGKSAHSASPEKGVNAICEASKVLLELKKSELKTHEKLGTGSICVIDIEGGGAPASVADKASFSVFRHVTIGEDRDYLRKEVELAVKRANIEGKYNMSFRDAPHKDNGGFQPYVVSESNPYTKAMKECIKSSTGVEANISYFPSIGDFNYLGSRAKLPTYVIGANGENYHGADEYVELDTVLGTAKIIYNYLKFILVE